MCTSSSLQLASEPTEPAVELPLESPTLTSRSSDELELEAVELCWNFEDFDTFSRLIVEAAEEPEEERAILGGAGGYGEDVGGGGGGGGALESAQSLAEDDASTVIYTAGVLFEANSRVT